MVHAYGDMIQRLEALITSRVDKQWRIVRMFIHVCTLTYCTFTRTVFYVITPDNYTPVARLTS